MRKVIDARFVEVMSPFGLQAGDRLLAFDITASSFCHQMVPLHHRQPGRRGSPAVAGR